MRHTLLSLHISRCRAVGRAAVGSGRGRDDGCLTAGNCWTLRRSCSEGSLVLLNGCAIIYVWRHVIREARDNILYRG
jgi:hypothetical protein